MSRDWVEPHEAEMINLMQGKKYPLMDKGKACPSGDIVLGIQLKCPDHGWQRTIYIKDGIGCSYCYGQVHQHKCRTT